VLQTVAADRFAVLLPLFHSYMLTVGCCCRCWWAAPWCWSNRCTRVRNVLQEILQRHSDGPARHLPQFYRSMAAAPDSRPLPLRICVSGAAPLPVQVLTGIRGQVHIPLIEDMA